MPSWKRVIVSGSNAALNSLTVTNGITGSLFGTASWANNATSASFATTASFTTAIAGTTNYVSKFTGTNTLGNSQIFDNGTNVGIGTTSPSYKLDLGVSNGMRLGSLNIVDGGSQISSNSSLLRIYSGTGVKLSYFNGTSIVDGFLMNSSGNVGIGTMSPQTRLDVYNGDFSQLKLSNSFSSQQLWFGSVADTIGSFIGNNTRYTNSLQFTPNSSAASGIYFRQDGSTEFFNNTGLTNGVLYTPSVSIKIGNTGNVGIGTTSPNAKLDVNGNTIITGSLIVSQSLLQYSNITAVTSGSTSNVASFNTSSYTAAFFDYVTTSGTNARAGSVFTVWNGTSVEYTETSTNDIGSTTNLVLSASVNSGAVRLQATSLSGSWSVKTLARML